MEIFAEALDKEIRRDWSVGLGAPLGDKHTDKLKIYFLSYRDFFWEMSRYWISNVLQTHKI